MQQRCARQNLGFEPLVLESTGGFCGETATLLQSLAKVVDTREHLPPGHTWQQLQERLSIDLQRGLHGACLKQRQQWSRSTLSLTASATLAGGVAGGMWPDRMLGTPFTKGNFLLCLVASRLLHLSKSRRSFTFSPIELTHHDNYSAFVVEFQQNIPTNFVPPT
jgi:hypothetical protein